MPAHKETLLQRVAVLAPEADAPNFSFFCPDVLPRQQNPIRAYERPLRAAEDMWHVLRGFRFPLNMASPTTGQESKYSSVKPLVRPFNG
ncbi:hypothetical protein EYF80_029648 [Liparis tanakae]|uniref:Uncharacterized protein n=1 Tax=Liparis tanakae TaxID=230148 RepID=A0A4Z2H2S5_9TELE|nr:hypothetical protein EYF80_029648 [Liparis tanakae]